MKNIILIGMKSAGKTTVGRALALLLNMPFLELDECIEDLHATKAGKRMSCREIFIAIGESNFRALETEALHTVSRQDHAVVSCGGGTPLSQENQKLLKSMGTIIFLDVDEAVLLARIIKGGVPAFFPFPNDPKRSLHTLLTTRNPVYQKIATITVMVHNETPELIAKIIKERLQSL